MREVTIALIILFLIPVAYSLKASVEEGKIIDIGTNEFLVSFGMVKGSINFRLGDYKWPAKEVWLVREGTLPSYFKSTGNYLEVPENITSSTCKTSVYYNESLGYAFKILSSQITESGSFCGLAYNGSYEILAKF